MVRVRNIVYEAYTYTTTLLCHFVYKMSLKLEVEDFSDNRGVTPKAYSQIHLSLFPSRHDLEACDMQLMISKNCSSISYQSQTS